MEQEKRKVLSQCQMKKNAYMRVRHPEGTD
jgi:hypothetical protein